MTAALHPAEPVIATERSRRGGRAGKRASGSATFEQPPFRQLKIPLAPTKLISDDQLETIHLASLRVLKEIGVDVLHDGARKIMKDHGADVREGSERVRFDADMILELIAHAPPEFTHPCAQPRAQCPLRRQQSGHLADGVGAQLLRSRPRPAPRQPGGFPQFPEAGADAQHPQHDRRLSGRAGRHPSVGPPSRMHPRSRRC